MQELAARGQIQTCETTHANLALSCRSTCLGEPDARDHIEMCETFAVWTALHEASYLGRVGAIEKVGAALP